MQIDTHTHITLYENDLREIIVNYIKDQGFTISASDIDFKFDQGGPYDSAKFLGCTVICGKKERVIK